MKLFQKTLLPGILMLTAGLLNAENLQVGFANLQNGSRIADCVEFTVQLDASVDNSTIKEIRVYANGLQFARIRKEPWEAVWPNLVSGYYHVYAKVTDNEGLEAFSDTLGIVVGLVDEGNLILNGNFNCSITKWSIQNNSGAQSSIEWEADAAISDGGAVFINVTNGGTEDWHVQMLQTFPIDSGHVYEITFIAETPGQKDIGWAMQENAGAFTYYAGEKMTAEGNNFYGPYEFIAPITDPNNAFKFYLGLNNLPIYFDDIMVIDRSVIFPEEPVSVDQAAAKPADFIMLDNYPNPFNGATVIAYSVPTAADLTLRIMNIRGELVRTLVNGPVQPGDYKAQWDGTNASGAAMVSGTYIAQLSSKSAGKTRIRTIKLMLIE